MKDLLRLISKIRSKINLSQRPGRVLLWHVFLLGIFWGVGLNSWLGMSIKWIVALNFIGIAGLAVAVKKPAIILLAVAILGMILGWWRLELTKINLDARQLAYYNDGALTKWRGVVKGEPDERFNQIKLTIEAKEVFQDGEWKRVSGKALIKADLFPKYNYGDNLEISCKLKTPEQIDSFDYQTYLERYGVKSLCDYPKIVFEGVNTGSWWYRAILKFKAKGVEIINSNLPEPQAGILSATLLGTKQSVPASWSQIFQKTGTTHVIAISGSHITLIVAIVMAILLGVGLSRNQAFYAAVSLLVVFIILIGAPAAAVRAGVMGFLVLWGLRLGRLTQAGAGLLLVAILMLWINPLILRGDTGFQLSCLAVAGLIWVRPLILPMFIWVPEVAGLRESLSMTLAAQITTWPLLAFGMGKLSLIGLVANIAIVPAATWILTTGLAGLALAMVVPFSAELAFWPAWLGITYMMKAADFFARSNWGYWENAGGKNLMLVLSYGVLIIVLGMVHKIVNTKKNDEFK